MGPLHCRRNHGRRNSGGDVPRLFPSECDDVSEHGDSSLFVVGGGHVFGVVEDGVDGGFEVEGVVALAGVYAAGARVAGGVGSQVSIQP